MNPLKILKHQLYLIQLENYDLRRFLRLMSRRMFPGFSPARKEIVWTAKLKTVFGFSLLLQFAAAWSGALLFESVYLSLGSFILFFTLLSVFFFVFLSVTTVLISPFDWAAKKMIVGRAKRKISKFHKLKIIGITGSYGKTTMKEALAAVLTQKYRVLKTPENINTPLGIARLILKNLTEDIEIFIVEMGAYQRGDIRNLCEITRPDIAFLTGISEAHLERFGSVENIIRAKFEIVESLRPDGIAVLNTDDQLLMDNCSPYVKDRKVLTYSSTKSFEYEFLPDGSGQKFALKCRFAEAEEKLTFHAKILGEYIIGVMDAVSQVAAMLGLNSAQVLVGASYLRPIPHRLEPIFAASGMLVIDDSYNGNPAGVREAIKVLSKFTDRRKVFVTPGLVETAQQSEQIHREIGFLLGSVADTVVLIESSMTPFIAKGLQDTNFDESKIKRFKSASEAHTAISDLVLPGDVIMFQNDWPDNYF